MTLDARRLARLWYGDKPMEAIASELGVSETEVRVQAVIVHRLGPRAKWDPTDYEYRTGFHDRRRELGVQS